jgi:methylated-DNA-protein-cysteine methyltransferase related protein
VGRRSSTGPKAGQRLKPEAPAASSFQGLPRYARLILDLVDAIPPGTVRCYGELAEELGEGGPRQVAQVMSAYGDEVPWHRVVKADGTCAPAVAMRQVPLLQDEGVRFVPGTVRIVAEQRPIKPAARPSQPRS